MSESHRYIVDANTGKYYTLVSEDRTSENVIQHRESLIYGQNQNGKATASQYADQTMLNSAKPQRNQNSRKFASQTQNLTIQQKSSNGQYIQQNESTTCQKNAQHDTRQHARTEHISTPRLIEQSQIPVNENEHEEDKDESRTVGDGDHQDAIATANKRALNDSDDFTTVGSNKARKNDHHKGNGYTNQDQRTMAPVQRNENENKYAIPLEHLQQAVIHNLPCFIINFRHLDHLPSAVAVSEDLYMHFEKQQVRISNGFSVVRYAGNQLKIGVKNKSDYQPLCDHRVWPAAIDSNSITVNMPKFVPGQFSLVVRYVPPEFETEQVAAEVQKSASSANNFRTIVYPYARATNDFRFTVSDHKEYNGLLRLGHIGVGNRMHKVTPYRPANKLTYCTKCWVLGHTRNKCQVQVQKCRICLLNYCETHNEMCSKIYKCAQCHQEHYSLDADCGVVQQYRNSLNRAVKQATEDGIIKLTTIEPRQPAQGPPPRFDLQTFPPVPSSTSRIIPRAWKTTADAPIDQQTRQIDISNHELFEKICSHFEERSKEVDSRLLKLEQEVQHNGKIIAELRQSLTNIVGLLKVVTIDVIPTLSKSSLNMDQKNSGVNG